MDHDCSTYTYIQCKFFLDNSLFSICFVLDFSRIGSNKAKLSLASEQLSHAREACFKSLLRILIRGVDGRFALVGQLIRLMGFHVKKKKVKKRGIYSCLFMTKES